MNARIKVLLALTLPGACTTDGMSNAPPDAMSTAPSAGTVNSAAPTAPSMATPQRAGASTRASAGSSAGGGGRAGTTSPTTTGGAATAATATAGARAAAAGTGGTTGGAGQTSSAAAGTTGAGGQTSSAAAGAGASGAAAANGGRGTLPVPSSLDKAGPFEILDQPDTGPGKQFRLFAPKPLGADGLKHPVVAWSPGAGAFPDAYLTFLNLLASQGFVTLSYNSTADGSNLVDAIDWLLAENERADSVLYGKLDTQKIAAGGHSAGSLATYQMADDPRLTTTLHMSGGSMMPQTDVPKLKKPALMVCGDAGGDGLTTGDLANPMCIADFQMAQVPVFYAVVKGAGHTALNDAAATLDIGTAPDDPKKALFFKATIGWLRWQLADDQALKKMFVGDDCELCKDAGYVVMSKNLN